MDSANTVLEPILLVEDDTQARETMGFLLNMNGFEVISAADGAEALCILRQRCGFSAMPLVLVTDMEMPGLHGRALVAEARKLEPLMGILVITGYGTRELVAQLLEMGVDGYMDKPFQSQVLVERVTSIAQQVKKLRKALVDEEKAEDTSKQSLEMLDKAVTAANDSGILSKLMAGLIHDMNNQLSVIIGYTQIIENEKNGHERPTDTIPVESRIIVHIRDAAETAHRNIGRLYKLINAGEGMPVVADIHEIIEDALLISSGALGRSLCVETAFEKKKLMVRVSRPECIRAFIQLFLLAKEHISQAGKLSISTLQSIESCGTTRSDSIVAVTVSVLRIKREYGVTADPGIPKRESEPLLAETMRMCDATIETIEAAAGRSTWRLIFKSVT